MELFIYGVLTGKGGFWEYLRGRKGEFENLEIP
jgi:hypothetical protein